MLRLAGAELVEVPAVPYRNPNNYVKLLGAPGRGAGAERAERRDLGQPVRQRRQPPGPYRHDRPGDLGADRRQGRRLHLRRRLRRHAGGRRHGPEGTKPDVKIGLADPMGAALYSYYTTGELKSEGSSITEGIGQGRITANLEGLPVDVACQDPRRGGAAATSSTCSRRRGSASAARPASTSPARSAWRRSWARATPSSPSSATTARATSRSCSTPPSCRQKDLPVPDWLEHRRARLPTVVRGHRLMRARTDAAVPRRRLSAPTAEATGRRASRASGGSCSTARVFYPTGGGQPGDSGRLDAADGGEIAIATTAEGDGGRDRCWCPAEGAACRPSARAVTPADRLGPPPPPACACTPRCTCCRWCPAARSPAAQIGAEKSRLDFDMPEAARGQQALTGRAERPDRGRPSGDRRAGSPTPSSTPTRGW